VVAEAEPDVVFGAEMEVGVAAPERAAPWLRWLFQ
jgi:hypothetical protein